MSRVVRSINAAAASDYSSPKIHQSIVSANDIVAVAIVAGKVSRGAFDVTRPRVLSAPFAAPTARAARSAARVPADAQIRRD